MFAFWLSARCCAAVDEKSCKRWSLICDADGIVVTVMMRWKHVALASLALIEHTSGQECPGGSAQLLPVLQPLAAFLLLLHSFLVDAVERLRCSR